MEEDLVLTRRAASTCPRCGAAARGEVSWCTQCYLDLSPAPAAPSVPAAPARTPDVVVGVAPARSAAPLAAAGPTWPCPCGTANSFDEAICADCGAGFLSRLRDDEAPSLLLPVVGDVARFTRTQRLLGACAAAFVLSLILLAVALLL